MARDFAQVYQSIWSDKDFRARDGDEQLLYLKLLSWPTLNYAGVLPLQPRKWANATAGETDKTVSVALERLDAGRYALVDWDTEEVLLRTFIRGDKLYRNPPMLRSALRSALQVESPRLRAALAEELALVRGLVADELTGDVQGALDALSDGVTHPVAHPLPDGVVTPSETPVAHGVPDPVPDGVADPPGTGTGAVSSRPLVTSEGDVQKADAREQHDADPPDVPDAGPAPPEEPPDDDRAPAAPVHENAMPPARCRNHLELANPPKCGNCRDARLAQDAWIADRDAKVARGLAMARAEANAQKAAERKAIGRCGVCDERGMTEHGVRCGHTPADAVLGPGKAAFQAVRESERQRIAAKRTQAGAATGLRRVTPVQLSKLGVIYDRRGMDREARLADLSGVLGREVSSMGTLTRAEASYVIDHLEGPPLPPEPAEDGGPGDDGVWVPEVGDEPPQDRPPTTDETDGERDEDGEELPPYDDESGGFEDEYHTDQRTRDEADDGSGSYVYAGSPDESDDPPFAHCTGFDLAVLRGECIV